MHKKIKKLLVWSLVVSMVLTNMLFSNFAFAATKSTALASLRLAGADRYQTAVEISKADWTTSQYAVLAYGEGFADALAAAPLAGKYDAPILLTQKDSVPAAVLDELKRLGVKNVFIVGGEGVVSKAVADALVAAGMTPERLAGADRYATALAVANKLGTTTEVVVAYGEGFADALSISAIAAAKGMPILLTDKDAMSADVKAYIGTKKAYIVGGEGVVSAAVANGLTTPVRLSGADRYATNLAVLQQFAANMNWLNVFVATGEGFADALAGSALAARYGSPVVLADSALAAATSSFLAGKVNSQTGVIAFGGAAVVSDAVVSAVKPAAPTSLAVDSITSIGLRGVKVVFTNEVDKTSAETIGYYQLDGVPLGANDKASLSSDNKTLTVLLGSTSKRAQYQKSLFTVKSNSVLSKDTLTSVPKMEKELVFSDTEIPAVKAVTVTGNKKLTVEFTEPVKMDGTFRTGAGSSFKIDGQYISSFGFSEAAIATKETDDNYSNKLNLIFAVAIPAGSHTLKTPKGSDSSLIDGAAYKLVETDTAFSVDTVSAAPSIVSVTGENNGTVYVTYERAMDKETAVTNFADNYLIGTKKPYAAEFKSNTGDTVVKLSFLAEDIADGANVLEINKGVKDAWGNKLDPDNNKRVSFSVTKDTVKPTVVSVTLVTSTNMRVKFSENVSKTYARNIANYVLKDSSGVDISGEYIKDDIDSVPTTNTDSDTYSINLKKDLTGSNYSLKVKNIVDLAKTPNTMDEYIATVNGIDEVAPAVTQVVAVSSSKAAVYFTEAMDVATITDINNFAYVDNQSPEKTHSLPSSATLAAGEGNKYVTITFPTGYTVTDSIANVSAYNVVKVRVSNTKDTAGNLLNNISQTEPVKPAGQADAGKPSYSKNTFKLFADSSKVWAEFELNQTLGTLDLRDFDVTGTTADTGYISGKKVVLNFTQTYKMDAVKELGPAAVLNIAGTYSKNVSNIIIAALVAETVYDDQVAPGWNSTPEVKIGSKGGASTAVVLTFSEDIDGSIAGLYTDDFDFVRSGKVLSVSEVVVNPANKNEVEFYFSVADSLQLTDKPTVKAVAAKVDIRDTKDSGAKDYNKYVPKSEQISGYTVQ